MKGAVAYRKATVVAKRPYEVLRDLRMRAGLDAADVARKLGYASTNGYIQYEYPKQGDKLIPYRIVKGVLPLFTGRGTPPITADEIIAISESRSLQVDKPSATVLPFPSPAAVPGVLPVRYRIEAGVYHEESMVGKRVYGESPMRQSVEFEAGHQFAAVVSDDPKRTVLHCVTPGQVGVVAGRRVVVLRKRGASDLVEVALTAYDKDGKLPATERPVGVVIGSYSRE